MRKPTSKLETALDDAQQAQVVDWLLGGMPYHQAREMVAKEFGVKVPLSSFSRFWQRVCGPALLAKRRQAVETAEALADEARSRPGQFDAATIDALKQKAFELSVNPVANPKDVKALFGLVLKARDQSLEERRVRLLEKKAEQADRMQEVIQDNTLSPEEVRRRCYEILGRTPPQA